MSLEETGVEFAGIGRTVDDDWLLDLEDNFIELASNIPASLVLFERPGIYYAHRKGINENLYSPNSIVSADITPEGLIETLIERRALDQVATYKSISDAALKGFKLDHDQTIKYGDDELITLFGYVYDVKDLRRQGSYQIQRERNAVRAEFDIPPFEFKDAKSPSHTIKLGGIACSPGVIGRDFFQEWKSSMNFGVDFSRVAEIVPKFRSPVIEVSTE
jgi:hypothetical protein